MTEIAPPTRRLDSGWVAPRKDLPALVRSKPALFRNPGYSAGIYPVALLVETRARWHRLGFAAEWCACLGRAIVEADRDMATVRAGTQLGAGLLAEILGRRERMAA